MRFGAFHVQPTETFINNLLKIFRKMFYSVKARDYIRVPPKMFNLSKKESVLKNVKASYEGYISKELGFVVNVIDVGKIKEGVIVPGDGAAFYETEFELLTFKPELNELV